MVHKNVTASGELSGQTARVLSWNINGLRAMLTRCTAANKTLADELESLNADIICFQETKLISADLTADIALVQGWTSYFSHYRGGRGYSGVATYVRDSYTLTPYQAEEGVTGVYCCPVMNRSTSDEDRGRQQVPDPFRPLTFGGDANGDDIEHKHCCAIPGHKQLQEQLSKKEMEEIDREGRCLITDHGNFVLFNVYAHSVCTSDNDRCIQKANLFRAIFLRANSLLRQKRHVMIVGDLNVALNPIDRSDLSYLVLKKEKSLKAISSTAEAVLAFETNRIRQLLKSALKPQGPFVDAFRKFHSNRLDACSCWSNATNARQTNYGSRIDLILYGSYISSQEEDHSSLVFCDLWPEKLGSDHCPVWCDVKIIEEGVPHNPPQLAAQNLPHFQAVAKKQLSLDDYSLLEKPHRNELENIPDRASSVRRHANSSGAKQISLTTFLSKANSSQDLPSRITFKQDDDTSGSQCHTIDQNQPVSEAQVSGKRSAEKMQEQGNAKAAWMTILGKGNRPTCRCGEPSVERMVKKAGPNFGRRFFVCSRPAAVPGHPEGRCDFFKWAILVRSDKIAKKPRS